MRRSSRGEPSPRGRCGARAATSSRGRGSRCGRGGANRRSSVGGLLLGFRRRRFADVVERQLDLFEREHAGLIRDCDAALAAYTEADTDEAEERYGDFVDLVDTGRDELVALRDGYAGTLDDDAAEEYVEVFNARVRRRLPRFGLELE